MRKLKDHEKSNIDRLFKNSILQLNERITDVDKNYLYDINLKEDDLVSSRSVRVSVSKKFIKSLDQIIEGNVNWNVYRDSFFID